MKILISRVTALMRMPLVVLIVLCAHDTVAETTSDLVDAPVRHTSVVSDWKAVCQHLNRTNLSGSGCLPYWNVLSPTTNFSLPKEQLDQLCPTLCNLSLGLPSCVCITPYRRLWTSERHRVCQLFCDVTQEPLDGCSPCIPEETTTELPTTTESSTTTTSTTTKSTTKSTTPSTTKTTKTTSTTPDWAALCNVLCQIGEGGVLCNCDLPPFF